MIEYVVLLTDLRPQLKRHINLDNYVRTVSCGKFDTYNKTNVRDKLSCQSD